MLDNGVDHQQKTKKSVYNMAETWITNEKENEKVGTKNCRL
jgi:hypothetical protein